MSDTRSGINGPKGQIWILAALTLPYKERIEAMNDIADMLGTTYAAVQSVASRLRARAHTEAVQAGYKQDGYMPVGRHKAVLASALRQPTKAQLMAGR